MNDAPQGMTPDPAELSPERIVNVFARLKDARRRLYQMGERHVGAEHALAAQRAELYRDGVEGKNEREREAFVHGATVGLREHLEEAETGVRFARFEMANAEADLAEVRLLMQLREIVIAEISYAPMEPAEPRESRGWDS